MSVDKFDIILDRRNPEYSPGENVTGTVVLKISNGELTSYGINLRFYGVADTRWTEIVTGTHIYHTYRAVSTSSSFSSIKEREYSYHSRGETDSISTEYPLGNQVAKVGPGTTTIFYSSTQSMFNETITLYGADNGYITEGEKSFPFSFKIPNMSLPPSCKFRYGSVKYGLVASILRPWYRPDTRAGATFNIVETITLEPSEANKISQVSGRKTFGCFDCDSYLEMTATASKIGHYPGEIILVNIEVMNESNKGVRDITVQLKQVWEFTAASSRLFSTRYSRRLYVMPCNSVARGEGVPPHEKVVWQVQFPIPNDIPPTCRDTICKLISMHYALKIEAIVDSIFSSNHKIILPIIIGSLPQRNQQAIISQQSLLYKGKGGKK